MRFTPTPENPHGPDRQPAPAEHPPHRRRLAGGALDALHRQPRIPGQPPLDHQWPGGLLHQPRRPPDLRRPLWTVVHRPGPCAQGNRRRREPPGGHARLFTCLPVRSPAGVRTGQPDRRTHARRPQPRVLHRLRLGVGRHGAEDGARLLAHQGPGQQDAVDRSRQGLPRRELRRHLGGWHRGQPQAVRPGRGGRPSAPHPAAQWQLSPRHAARGRAARCRAGSWTGSEAFGVTPDILNIAKQVTNGAQPLGAVIVRQDICDTFMAAGGPEYMLELPHGYTYSDHPVACAAGIASLDLLESDNALQRGREPAPHFETAVHGLQGAKHVADVRNFGLAAGITIAPLPGEPARRPYEIAMAMYQKGFYVRYGGATIQLAPPFISTPSEIDSMVSALGDTLNATV